MVRWYWSTIIAVYADAGTQGQVFPMTNKTMPFDELCLKGDYTGKLKMLLLPVGMLSLIILMNRGCFLHLWMVKKMASLFVGWNGTRRFQENIWITSKMTISGMEHKCHSNLRKELPDGDSMVITIYGMIPERLNSMLSSKTENFKRHEVGTLMAVHALFRRWLTEEGWSFATKIITNTKQRSSQRILAILWMIRFLWTRN